MAGGGGQLTVEEKWNVIKAITDWLGLTSLVLVIIVCVLLLSDKRRRAFPTLPACQARADAPRHRTRSLSGRHRPALRPVNRDSLCKNRRRADVRVACISSCLVV